MSNKNTTNNFIAMKKSDFYKERKVTLTQEYKDLRKSINADSNKKHNRSEALEKLSKKHEVGPETIKRIISDNSYLQKPNQ